MVRMVMNNTGVISYGIKGIMLNVSLGLSYTQRILQTTYRPIMHAKKITPAGMNGVKSVLK